MSTFIEQGGPEVPSLRPTSDGPSPRRSGKKLLRTVGLAVGWNTAAVLFAYGGHAAHEKANHIEQSIPGVVYEIATKPENQNSPSYLGEEQRVAADLQGEANGKNINSKILYLISGGMFIGEIGVVGAALQKNVPVEQSGTFDIRKLPPPL